MQVSGPDSCTYGPFAGRGARWRSGTGMDGIGRANLGAIRVYGLDDTVTRMKTTVELPDALAREARALARSQGSTLRELIVDGLRAEIRRRSGAPETARFTFRTVSGQGLQAGVAPATLTERAYDSP